MYRFWDSIIEPALRSISAVSIVEIGVGGGLNTGQLLQYVSEKAGTLTAIDPHPACDMEALAMSYGPRLRFLRELSLNALPTIERYDAVLIDGDHNWYTVFHELLIVEKYAKKSGVFPLIFIHDTGWPYARRDMYGNPDVIPAAYRQPYERGGLLPSTHAILPDRGINASFFHSIYENNVRNGVLTAVEDFLEQTGTPMEFITIPCGHGLGILIDRALVARHPALAELLPALRISAPVSRLFQNLEWERIASCAHEAELQTPDTAAVDRTERLQTEERRLHEEQERLRNMSDEMEREREEAEKNMRREREHLSWLRGEAEKQIAEAGKQISRAALEQERVSNIEATCVQERERMAKELRESERLLREKEEEMTRILSSRSWRITSWLRWMDAAKKRLTIKNLAYATFRNLKDLWTDFGEPCPRLIRWIRHHPLALLWPVRYPKTEHIAPIVPARPTIGIVIPCHNYGRYLSEAIESVLSQTVAPNEVVIVDDASEDDTETVARSYEDKGVRYLRGDWRSVGAARNAGIDATRSEFLVFLDADDILHPQYIGLAAEIIPSHPEAGIFYSSQEFFGDKEAHYEPPEVFDWRRFDAVNHINVTSVVRREALLQAGKFSHGVNQDGDWVTWRKILRLGWKALKFQGMLFCRSHDDSMSSHLSERQRYSERAGFFEEPATLFLALSGRAWAWPRTADFLSKQTFPHDRIHLVVLDTSQNPDFGTMVKSWLETSDYGGHTYMQETVGAKGLADRARNDDDAKKTVAEAVAAIYNRFARMCTTTLAFILEDDVIPPVDAYPRLIASFEKNTASVSGFYMHRLQPHPVAWMWDAATGMPVFPAIGKGIAEIGGNGFGCVVLRGERMRHTVFHAGPPFGNFDHNFYDTVRRDGDKALIDWDCVCAHLTAPV